jgi:5'-nucleotidase-like protein
MRAAPLLLILAGCVAHFADEAPDAGACAENSTCAGATGACVTDQGSTEFEDVRVAEDTVANLIADVLRSEGSAAAGEPIDVAFLNGGSIRGGRSLGPPTFAFTNEEARIGRKVCAGPLTDDDVRGWQPFANDVVVMTLTGAQVKRALESGVRTWADDQLLTFGPDLVRDKGGELLHVSGMSYEVTCPGTTRIRIGPSDCNPFAGTCKYENAAAASSITKIAIGGTTIYDATKGGWQGDGETRRVRAIMNSFIAAGLDNHLDFEDGTERKTIAVSDWNFTEVLVKYMRAHAPVTLGAPAGRIRVLGTVEGLGCNLPASCVPAHRTHPNCAHL